MQMTTLIGDIEVLDVRGDPDRTEVESVEFDSRQVRPGSLFCCVPGANADGHRFATEAVDGGATSLLCEHYLDLDVTQVRVAPGMVKPAMAGMAAAFFGYPARAMAMVGVTGTNGKTTVTQLVRSILDHAGRPAGVVGTLDGIRTTPESPILQRLLSELRDDGRQAVAIEVSSHALTQHRVDGMVFDVAAFTNLSRDHLDHHQTMEQYFEAKALLFESSRSRLAVVNVDDRWGRTLAGGLAAHAVTNVQRSDASHIALAVGSSSFEWRGQTLMVPMSGLFNVDNALMAVTVASLLGVAEDQMAGGLAALPPVPGRMETVSAGGPFTVFVDYAHTPAGLDAALAAARGLAVDAQVICLFGCGGDRDQGKRPEMGAAAARWSDIIVLTSDNPRSEDPVAIIDQIRSGIDGPARQVIEPDRATAIGVAVDLARPGDVVVLAGKGHETTQTIGGQVRAFDDRVEARRALAGRVGDIDSNDRGPGGDQQ